MRKGILLISASLAALTAATMLPAIAQEGFPDIPWDSAFAAVSEQAAQGGGMFVDVPKDHWAYQAVYDLKQKGILVGYPDGSFLQRSTPQKRATKAKASKSRTKTSHQRAQKQR